MKKITLKSIASLLVLTVASLAAVPSYSEAMLAPANTVQNSPQVDRAADMQTIQSTLESKILRERLHGLGLSDAEIQTRLSRLSDSEVHQLASQIRSVHPAGGLIIGVLIAVLLVVLIIYLIKRL